jgi:hypothetical protein
MSRYRTRVRLTGTLPGKLVIVKPIPVIVFTNTDFVDAIQPGTYLYSAGHHTKGEALAGLRREIVLALKYLQEEEVDDTLPRHMHAAEMSQLEYLREHIAPQGSERAKKRG